MDNVRTLCGSLVGDIYLVRSNDAIGMHKICAFMHYPTRFMIWPLVIILCGCGIRRQMLRKVKEGPRHGTWRVDSI